MAPAPTDAPVAAPERPLEELLRADGTLDLSTGFRGSLDPTGWQLRLGADGAPRFVRAGLAAAGAAGAAVVGAGLPGGELATALAAPGDEHWAHGSFNGTPIGEPVTAAVIDGGYLYIGGEFSVVGNIRANRVARWSAATGWEPLGYGLSSAVYALAVAGDGTLYAGGGFTHYYADTACTSGTPVNSIARWDGSNWAPLENGVNGWVAALAVAGDGTLYVGGNFTRVCTNGACTTGSDVNFIARWSSAGGWASLGSGVAGSVLAASVVDGRLYVGGYFSLAGNHVAPNVSIYAPLADLRPSLASSASSVVQGLPLTYTITVTDYTGVETPAVLLTDTLPAGLMLTSAEASQGSCVGSGPVVCSLGTLEAWASARVTVTTLTTGVGALVNQVDAGSGVKPSWSSVASTASLTVTVLAAPTPTPTASPTATGTATPVPPTASPTPTATPTATATPSATPVATETATATPLALAPRVYLPFFPWGWKTGW